MPLFASIISPKLMMAPTVYQVIEVAWMPYVFLLFNAVAITVELLKFLQRT